MIVLIGPNRAGKSTVGRLLAKALDLPFQHLAMFNRDHLDGSGFDEEAMERAWTEGGFDGWYRYLQPFQPHALRSFLAAHPCGVVELDAPLMALDDAEARAAVARLLAPYLTVLLLPGPDVEASVRILRDRQRIMYNGMDLNEYFVRHPANQILAKITVYTQGKTPAETADDVLARIDQGQKLIILIGPMGTGKSTIAQLLAERLGWPRESLDHHRWRYYEEAGFTQEEMRRIDAALGPQGVLDYWKRFDVHAVERLLGEYAEGVIDFGAGHSVYDDPADLQRVRARLAPVANVVLLLPSPDPDESLRILDERTTPAIGGVELTRYLLTHPASRALAKVVVYTEGKTPAETRDEILRRAAS